MGKVRLAGKVAGWIEFRQFINLATCSDRTWKLPDAAHWQDWAGYLGWEGQARTSHPATPDQLDPYLDNRAAAQLAPGTWVQTTKRS